MCNVYLLTYSERVLRGFFISPNGIKPLIDCTIGPGSMDLYHQGLQAQVQRPIQFSEIIENYNSHLNTLKREKTYT